MPLSFRAGGTHQGKNAPVGLRKRFPDTAPCCTGFTRWVCWCVSFCGRASGTYLGGLHSQVRFATTDPHPLQFGFWRQLRELEDSCGIRSELDPGPRPFQIRDLFFRRALSSDGRHIGSLCFGNIQFAGSCCSPKSKGGLRLMPLKAELRIRKIFIRIQDRKKFVLDPDPY